MIQDKLTKIMYPQYEIAPIHYRNCLSLFMLTVKDDHSAEYKKAVSKQNIFLNPKEIIYKCICKHTYGTE